MLEKTEMAIKNGQSRATCKIGHKVAERRQIITNATQKTKKYQNELHHKPRCSRRLSTSCGMLTWHRKYFTFIVMVSFIGEINWSIKIKHRSTYRKSRWNFSTFKHS